MAKRKRRQKQLDLAQRPDLIQKMIWGVIIVISILFGLSNGYPVAATGQIAEGLITGLAFGSVAFVLLALALFLNRKLRGH